MAGGRWRQGGGGREVVGGGHHPEGMGRAPPGRHGARTCRRARSTIGAPGMVPLCCRSTSCSRSRATCKAGDAQPLTHGGAGDARGVQWHRQACGVRRCNRACRDAMGRAACRDASERAACHGASGRAACRSSRPRVGGGVGLPLDCGRLGERHSRRRTRRRWCSSICGSRGYRRGPWPLAADPHNRRLHLHHNLGRMARKLPQQVSQRR